MPAGFKLTSLSHPLTQMVLTQVPLAVLIHGIVVAPFVPETLAFEKNDLMQMQTERLSV